MSSFQPEFRLAKTKKGIYVHVMCFDLYIYTSFLQLIY